MITMADIAKRAGVSRSTASLVLNNRQDELRISADTQQRVLNAAREMGYLRNELARAVGSGKNFVLGFVKMSFGEQESRILEGVLKASTSEGYLVKLVFGTEDERYRDVIRHCVEQRLAGVVCRSFTKAEVTRTFSEELGTHGIPIVFVDDDLRISGTSCVTSDDERGYRLIVEHLIGLGHRNLAFIAGDSVHPQSLQRKEIYRRVMQEHGVPVPPGSIVDMDWDLRRTVEITRTLFADRHRHPTALVCAGDEHAAVAMRTLSQLGLGVPEDVSVVGYGNFSFTPLLNPPLTTVAQPFEEMGMVATRRLFDRLRPEAQKAPEEDSVILPTQLLIRESTAQA
jgi:DNA-binding LacI/PurR family transcriptional regulator